MLEAYIGPRAHGRSPGHRRPGVAGQLEVVLGAAAGQDRDGDMGAPGDARGRLEQFLVAVARPAVLDRAGSEAVPVPDGDRPYAGLIQRSRDRLDVIDSELMRDGVRAVTERGVHDPHGGRPP